MRTQRCDNCKTTIPVPLSKDFTCVHGIMCPMKNGPRVANIEDEPTCLAYKILSEDLDSKKAEPYIPTKREHFALELAKARLSNPEMYRQFGAHYQQAMKDAVIYADQLIAVLNGPKPEPEPAPVSPNKKTEN